jgi:hypothetical protein
MTTTTTVNGTLVRNPAARTVALAVCALLGLLDVAGTAGLFSSDGPPVFIVLPGTILGLLTLAATLPALRGSEVGLNTVLGSRFVSAVMGFVAFFDDEAPHWARVVVAVSIAVTLAAFGLLALPRQEPARGTRP